MSIRPDGRPPFRADHVGSLLRPAALRQAFRRHAASEIGDARIRRHPGPVHPRRGADAGGDRPRGGDRRRVPPRLLLGALRRSAPAASRSAPRSFTFRDDHGHEVEFTAPYATARLQTHAAARARRIRVPARRRPTSTPKITLPAPSTMHFYRCADFADRQRLSGRRELLRRPGSRCSAQEIAELAAAGCRYLQLDEVAIALLCDPAIREQGRGARAPIPTRLVDLYIDAINQAVAACPPDVVVGVHMCRGNLKGHYLGGRRLRVGRRAVLRRHPRQPFPARIRHAAGRRFRAAALRAEDQGRRARARQQQDPCAREPRTACAAAWRTPPDTSISIGWRSARNADSPARSRAIR